MTIKPRIIKAFACGWQCFTPGEVSHVAWGITPQMAYLAWKCRFPFFAGIS